MLIKQDWQRKPLQVLQKAKEVDNLSQQIQLINSFDLLICIFDIFKVLKNNYFFFK